MGYKLREPKKIEITRLDGGIVHEKNLDHRIAEEISIKTHISGTLGMRYVESKAITIGDIDSTVINERVLLNKSDVKCLSIYKAIMDHLYLNGANLGLLNFFGSSIDSLWVDEETKIGRALFYNTCISDVSGKMPTPKTVIVDKKSKFPEKLEDMLGIEQNQ